jgi:hypothetical protein
VTLPPVVSDPEVCDVRIDNDDDPELVHWQHDWKFADPLDGRVVVCRYCEGRKP